MMQKVLPSIIQFVEGTIKMPDYLRQQLPDLFPEVVDNVLPKMLPEITPRYVPIRSNSCGNDRLARSSGLTTIGNCRDGPGGLSLAVFLLP